MASDYQNLLAAEFRFGLEFTFFIAIRNLSDVQKTVEKLEQSSLQYSDQFTIMFLGLKAQLQTLLKDYDEAKKSLTQVEEIVGKQGLILPFYLSRFFWARFFFNVNLLEEGIISNNKLDIAKYRDKAFKSGKKCFKNSKKCSFNRTCTLNLLGRYYWLVSNQKKATEFWKRAIEEGERLGARPDLARTYMEIGKRFLEEKSKFKELNGISAEEYLEKARAMFQEMDLQWDLDELDKISVTS